jgi:hypothetical protein
METSWNTKFSGAPAAEKVRVRAGSEFHTVRKEYQKWIPESKPNQKQEATVEADQGSNT